MKILFLDILTGDRKLREFSNKKIHKGSNCSEAMRKAFGLRPEEWESVDAAFEPLPKDIAEYPAIVIGGSYEDPVMGREKPWMRRTYPLIKKIIKKQIPLLGICGGLQFTVRTFGGKIIDNPKGREFGTIKVRLTQAGQNDTLFHGIPKNFFAQSSHRCVAKNLKPSWELLGSSELCRFQAIAIGSHIRLLQFHPEMALSELKATARAKQIKAYSAKNTSKTGKKILKNFLKYFVK